MALAETDLSRPVQQAFVDMIERLAGSRIASVVAIVIVALACFLPGINTIPPIDRDEPAFAEVAREMLASGDFATLRLNGDTLTGVRPPGLYWLEAAAVALVGGDASAPIWMYRLPSLFAAIAGAVLTWWMAIAFGRPRAALLAGLFMASSVVLAAEARLARPDAVLLMTVVLAQGALARLRLSTDDAPRYGMCALFWLAIGAGILVKGPIAPLIAGLTVAALCASDRSLAFLHRLLPAWGGLVLLLALLPWAIALGLRDVVPAAAGDLVAAGRIGTEAPPGTYALISFAILWPASSFAFLAAPWVVARFRRPPVLFALAWAVPFWIGAEFWPEKLPHYVLPVLPAFAFLAALAIDRERVAVDGRLMRVLAFATPGFAVLLGLGTPLVVALSGGGIPYTALPALLASVALAILAWRWLVAGAVLAAAGLSIIAACLMYLGSYGFVVPGFDRIHLSSRVLAASERAVPCADPQYVATGFSEPTLPFLAPLGRVRFADTTAAADFLKEPGCRVAIVDARRLSSFRQRAEDIGVELSSYGRVTGVNLGAGRRVTLLIFGTAEPPK